MSQADRFIAFAIKSGALWISAAEKRKLKSGRMSPYFFNTGDLATGEDLYELGIAYASALAKSELEFDVLLGPAYKGIPLASVTALSLFALNQQRVGYAFNRKEIKDHGEGGLIVGMPLRDKRVVIIDDVTTRGDAKREAIELIRRHGGKPVGIVVAFDRQERGVDSTMSATQQLEIELGVPVISIATASDLIHPLCAVGRYSEATAIGEYLSEYGAIAPSTASLKN